MTDREDLQLIRKKSRLFKDMIGDILDLDKLQSKTLKVGFFLWARHEPKNLFRQYESLNSLITNEKLNIFIDDNCSKIFMDIKQSVQDELIRKYIHFFDKCKVYISSKTCSVSVKDFFCFIKKVPYKSYYSFLPKRKSEIIEELKLGELMHTYLEIKTIEFASSLCDVLFVGKRSSNIAYFFHEHINSKCRFIIVDDFEVE